MIRNEKPFILVIGEILWDIFPDGKRIGGAPANFAYYMTKMETETILISRVGHDQLGFEALAVCRSEDLTIDFIQIDNVYPTGRVIVKLDKNGVPNFKIEEISAWDFINEEEQLFQLIKKARAFYFGTLAQRNENSRKTIYNLLANANPECIKVLDLNLRSPYYDYQVIKSSLYFADILKLSSSELKIVTELFHLSGSPSDQIRFLMKEFNLKVVALTAGSKGSLIITSDRESRHPGFPVNVVDTVGAGDAFTAALVNGLLNNDDLDQINEFANQLASYVCTQKGAWVNISNFVRHGYLNDE